MAALTGADRPRRPCAAALLLTAVAGLWAVGSLTPAAAVTGADAGGFTCSTALPPLPTVPAQVVRVTEFGARPNDNQDDSAAMQRALDSLAPGQWLVFPPGRYLQGKELVVRRRGVTLWGPGASLHATDPDAQALIVAEDGVSVLRLDFTAVTDRRRSAPVHSRIAVWRRDEPEREVRGVTLRGNRVLAAGTPGSRQANGASAGGIFLYRAADFLVADNTVERTLADGIHITAGSHHGRVLHNTVRETGDDMIAMVSYLGDGSLARNTAAELAASIQARTDTRLVHDVLVADNDVHGQYWGRGISVVGGRDISIVRNRISDTTTAAAIYLAREANYVSFGVHNVRVEDNTIAHVQTTEPRYQFGQPGHRAGHSAILLHSDVFTDEAALPKLLPHLALENIAILGNRIEDSAAGGVRISGWQPMGQVMTARRHDGALIERRTQRGPVRAVVVEGNRLSGVKGVAMQWGGGATEPVQCAANVLDGHAIAEAPCLPVQRGPVATGACGP